MIRIRTLDTHNWLRSAIRAGLIIAVMHGSGAMAAFTDDVAAGVDNTSFTYIAYQDGTDPPFLVANEGVGGGDAIRTGAITQSTFSVSAEGGFYFDFVGPGTLSFQWGRGRSTACGWCRYLAPILDPWRGNQFHHRPQCPLCTGDHQCTGGQPALFHHLHPVRWLLW